MKHLLASLLLSFLFIACNNQAVKNYSENTDSHSPKTVGNKTIKISKSWTKDKFIHPESIIEHPDSSYLFISNIGINPTSILPDGFISKVNKDGSFIERKFVKGIRGPKGLCYANGKLYVSTVKELLEINPTNGEITNTFTNDSIGMFNDIAKDTEGNIFVSDMNESAIYKLSNNGEFSLVYQNNFLDHPNGLLVDGENLIIGTWGRFDDNPDLDSTGNLFSLNLKTLALKNITENKPGKLDGIQKVTGGYLVSSWKAGEILFITPEGEVESILNTGNSIGDILYLEDENKLYAPMNFQNQVELYQINIKQ